MTRRERFIHRFQWFVLAGVLLLGIDMLVREGREETYADTHA
jgi:hypothetical protein